MQRGRLALYSVRRRGLMIVIERFGGYVRHLVRQELQRAPCPGNCDFIVLSPGLVHTRRLWRSLQI